MTDEQRIRLEEFRASTSFSMEQLTDAAIEYGLFFLDIIAEEASRLNLDPLTVAQSINAVRKKARGK